MSPEKLKLELIKVNEENLLKGIFELCNENTRTGAMTLSENPKVLKRDKKSKKENCTFYEINNGIYVALSVDEENTFMQISTGMYTQNDKYGIDVCDTTGAIIEVDNGEIGYYYRPKTIENKQIELANMGQNHISAIDSKGNMQDAVSMEGSTLFELIKEGRNLEGNTSEDPEMERIFGEFKRILDSVKQREIITSIQQIIESNNEQREENDTLRKMNENLSNINKDLDNDIYELREENTALKKEKKELSKKLNEQADLTKQCLEALSEIKERIEKVPKIFRKIFGLQKKLEILPIGTQEDSKVENAAKSFRDQQQKYEIVVPKEQTEQTAEVQKDENSDIVQE